MREKKDILEQIIKEDLEKEAAKIRETIAGMDQEILSAEKKAEIKEKLYEEINDYDVVRLMDQLPERYKKAMKMGLESLDSAIQSNEDEFDAENGILKERSVSEDASAEETGIEGEAGEIHAEARAFTEYGDRAEDIESTAESPGDTGEKRSEGVDSGNAGKKKKNIRRRKRIRVYVAAAAVLVMVATFGVNSFGGPENVMRAMKRIVGDREVSQVDSDEGNLVIEGETEEEAYQAIKETFSISPVKIINRPRGMKFISYNVEKEAQIAELLYKYDDKNILYMVNLAYSKDSFGMDVEDMAADEYDLEVRGVEIHIKEYQVADTGTKKYSADFDYKKAKYFLIATVEKADFELIVKNLYFSS